MPTPARQLCAVLHDGQVLTPESRRLPAYQSEMRLTSLTDRATVAGDPGAVLVAPQLQVAADPVTLLSVFAPRGEPVPGVWTPVEQLDEERPVVEALLEVDAIAASRREPPERRPEWFRTTWYDEVEAWVDGCLPAGRRRTGPARAQKAWSMSAVVEVPCDPAPVWVKASAHHFHSEPAFTRLVAELLPEHTPSVIATEDRRGWLMTEQMPGADEDDAPSGVGALTARTAATLQLRSLAHPSLSDAARLPVRDLTRTEQALEAILTDGVELGQLTADERAAARATRPRITALLGELGSLGIPDTLAHGDLHTGNVAHADGSLVLYDWSDACVAHPFLDMAHLGQRLPDEERAASQRAFADVWRAAYPGIDAARALRLAEPVNTLFQTVTFEQIYRSQEAASYWEMRGFVARSLRELPALVAQPGA